MINLLQPFLLGIIMAYFDSLNEPDSFARVSTPHYANSTVSPGNGDTYTTDQVKSSMELEDVHSSSNVSLTEVYVAGAGLAISAYILTIFRAILGHTVQCMTMRMRAAISSLIYRKVCHIC